MVTVVQLFHLSNKNNPRSRHHKTKCASQAVVSSVGRIFLVPASSWLTGHTALLNMKASSTHYKVGITSPLSTKLFNWFWWYVSLVTFVDTLFVINIEVLSTVNLIFMPCIELFLSPCVVHLPALLGKARSKEYRLGEL